MQDREGKEHTLEPDGVPGDLKNCSGISRHTSVYPVYILVYPGISRYSPVYSSISRYIPVYLVYPGISRTEYWMSWKKCDEEWMFQITVFDWIQWCNRKDKVISSSWIQYGLDGWMEIYSWQTLAALSTSNTWKCFCIWLLCVCVCVWCLVFVFSVERQMQKTQQGNLLECCWVACCFSDRKNIRFAKLPIYISCI